MAQLKQEHKTDLGLRSPKLISMAHDDNERTGKQNQVINNKNKSVESKKHKIKLALTANILIVQGYE